MKTLVLIALAAATVTASGVSNAAATPALPAPTTIGPGALHASEGDQRDEEVSKRRRRDGGEESEEDVRVMLPQRSVTSAEPSTEPLTRPACHETSRL